VATTTSSPRHPQTCGKKEREWSSLQQWLRARPPAHSKDELTKMVEAYEAIFNTSRPHQSLDGATPASVYQATAKAEPGPGGPQSRRFLHDVRASSRGYVDIARTRIRLGSDWAGADLDLSGRPGPRRALPRQRHHRQGRARPRGRPRATAHDPR